MVIKTASLTAPALRVIRDRGTEPPFSQKSRALSQKGTYLCRQCGLALFRSDAHFDAGCGWPSFDDEILTTVAKKADPDGRRTEIICSRCSAHLGHIFHGEGHSPKNTRYCVNSLSLDFVHDLSVLDTEEAIFAAGCFWGVEHLFKKLPGVLFTEVGYCGGVESNPSYEAVCEGKSQHVEAVRVIFDCKRLSYGQVARYFFEIHDPSQSDGQGPDIGPQYLSVAFYYDEAQKEELLFLSSALQAKGFKVATTLRPASPFWPAEEHHQEYYLKTQKSPYCHTYVKRFD